MTILQKQYIQYNLKFNKVKNAKIRSTYTVNPKI